MLKFLRPLVVAALLAFAANAGHAAGVPQYGPTNPALNPPIQGDLYNLVNAVNQWVNSSSMAPALNFRNWLDNGAMDIAQAGTGQVSCGGTGGSSNTHSNYGADRWVCIVNVGSQAGKAQVFTTSPPPGYNQYFQLIRNSGSLAQPVTALQEIQTVDATKLQNQTVVASCWMQALSGLAADNGSTAQLLLSLPDGSR